MEESLERSDQPYDAARTPIRLEPGEFKKIGKAYGLSPYMIEVVTTDGHEIRITARRNLKSGELVGGPALPYSASYEERVEIWVGDRRRRVWVDACPGQKPDRGTVSSGRGPLRPGGSPLAACPLVAESWVDGNRIVSTGVVANQIKRA